MKSIHVGTAGWSVPAAQAKQFIAEGSHLERYATLMGCAEINTSFYRPHQQSTWRRWAEAVPPDFRFSVKAPKTITHVSKLQNCAEALAQFFEQIAALGPKLGPVLFQLAPGHAFDLRVAEEFFNMLREMHNGQIVLEPRNESWFTAEVDSILSSYEIARVASDPAKGSPAAGMPGGFSGLLYYRLHGSPRVYWSAYDASQLEALSVQLRDHSASDRWVIFDNTAAGEALKNAIELRAMLAT